MNDHSHPHEEPEQTRSPETPVDAGSQALSEALRSSFAIVRLVMVLLVLVFLASGFFKVEPNEQAIILRFGKPRGEGTKALLGPGLHWSYPYPIDEIQKVSVTAVQRVIPRLAGGRPRLRRRLPARNHLREQTSTRLKT